jgi:hypothetical protein
MVVRPGDWIRLGNNIYHYRGEPEITWKYEGGLLMVNGEVVGINFTGLPINEGLALIRRYGKCIISGSWTNAQEIPLPLLRALRRHSSRGLGLQLTRFRGSGAGLSKLKVLGDRLDAVSYVSRSRGALGLKGLSNLSERVEVSVSVYKADDQFFRELGGINNLTKLHVAHVLPSNLFPNCLVPFTNLLELRIDRVGLGEEDLIFVRHFPRLWKLILHGSGDWRVKAEALARLKELRFLSLEKLPGGDSGLKFLRGLRKLRWLQLVCGSGDAIDVNGMMELRSLGQLSALSLSFCHVKQRAASSLPGLEGLKSLSLHYKKKQQIRGLGGWLSHLKHLEGITLSGVNLQEKGTAPLEPLRNSLLILALIDNGLTDEQVRGVRQFRRLEHLVLDGNPVGDRGIRQLRGMGNLKLLSLERLRLTDQALEHIGALPNLEYLRLGDNRVTDRGIRHLAELDGLRFLGLAGTKIGNRALRYLSGMKRLGKVVLRNTSVTNGAVLSFKSRRPDCEVVY